MLDFMDVADVCIVVAEEEPDDFVVVVEYFEKREAPLASNLDSVLFCGLLVDEDFPAVVLLVVVDSPTEGLLLLAPPPVVPVIFDPGTRDESAAFIRFPTLDPLRSDRDVLFSPTPSCSLLFLAA